MLTAWKLSKYGVISAPYFYVFGQEITPYLDTFQVVAVFQKLWKIWEKIEILNWF